MRNRILTTDLELSKLNQIFEVNDIFVLGQCRLSMKFCITSNHDFAAAIEHLIWDANPYAYCELKDATIEEVEYYESQN